MHLKILGTKGEMPESHPRHKKQSGILIDGVLLLDLGDKKYLKYNPKWILLTHLHPDHAYFVRRGKEETPETDAQIFGPEKVGKNIRSLKRKRKIGPYTIIPVPTHHAKFVDSQGYIIQKGDKSIFYTSDMIWIDKSYHPLFKNVDLIITEASFFEAGGMIRRIKETGRIYGHAGIPNLFKLFQPYAKKILFVHFGNWFVDNPKIGSQKLRALAKTYGVKILIGHDGKTIEV